VPEPQIPAAPHEQTSLHAASGSATASTADRSAAASLVTSKVLVSLPTSLVTALSNATFRSLGASLDDGSVGASELGRDDESSDGTEESRSDESDASADADDASLFGADDMPGSSPRA
jgi:hypothetical protein